MIRRPAFTQFYPGDARAQLDAFLRTCAPRPDLPASLVAAVAPHAGWRYSGAVAVRALKALADRSSPHAILLFGAVHRVRLGSSVAYPDGAWETPFGDLEVDEDLAGRLVDGIPGILVAGHRAHDSEHSIEVLAPFIREVFPGVPVVPIMVPPEASPAELGVRAARIAGPRGAVAVASTDLTHYGEGYLFLPAGTGEAAHEWMRGNDRRILDLAAGLHAERIPREADVHRNACGPGALAAAAAFARELGASRGTVLERTDSHEAQGTGEVFSRAVGYAGIVF